MQSLKKMGMNQGLSVLPYFKGKTYISPSHSPQPIHFHQNAKTQFSTRFPQINIQYYTQLTKQILNSTLSQVLSPLPNKTY